jgi:hypothetical protein
MEDRATTEMERAIEPADGDLLSSKELAGAHQTMHLCGGETEPGGLAHNDEMEKAGGAARAQSFSEQQGAEQQRGTNPSLLMAVNL